ncbi:MAG: hypothetical protein L0Y58_07680 [Verrucomicrobia subdivision 3 bacterium]|nr:hypothetical protein [Limisphaerales bacterium]
MKSSPRCTCLVLLTFTFLSNLPVPATPCGYMIAVPAGSYRLIANQCVNDVAVSALLPGVPFGTVLLKFNNALGVFEPLNIYSTAWSNPSQTLSPGEGAWIFNATMPIAAAVAGVANTPVLPLGYATCPGCYLVSRQTAVPGGYTDIMGVPPAEGAMLFKFDVATQSWLVFQYAAGAWDPSEPVVGVGESVWICPSGGASPPIPNLCTYTKTIPPGYSLIANQCVNANTVSSLIPSPPFGTLLLKYNNTSGSFETLNAYSSGWSQPSQTLAPGQGAWIYNPTATAFTAFIAGTAKTPSLPLSFAAGAGCYLVSRQTNAPGTYDQIMGVPPADGAVVHQFNLTSGLFDVFTFVGGAWSPAEPVAAVGEALWICPTGGAPPAIPQLCTYTNTIPSGYSLIANQCSNANSVSSLLPKPPFGALLLKYNNLSGTYEALNAYSSGWSQPSQTLAPGEGAWIYNPSSPFAMLVAGMAKLPSLPLPFATAPGCYLVSRQTNAPATYDQIVGMPPANGATLFQFNPAAGAWLAFEVVDGIWSPSDPSVGVGESVWICPTGGPVPAIPNLCSYTMAIPPGFSLIANQCTNANTIRSLIPRPAIGTRILKYNNATTGFEPYNIFGSSGWSIPTQTLLPAEGAWIYNPTATPFTILIAGLAKVPLLPLSFASGPGCYLVSRQTNAPATYEQIMGIGPAEGATVYKYNASSDSYEIFMYLAGVWDPSPPMAAVGEPLWICPTGGPVPASPCFLAIFPCLANATVTLSWPCSACVLQSTPALGVPVSGTVWTTVPGSSPVTVPITGSSQFFRLFCP